MLSFYPPADQGTQWFGSTYPGSVFPDGPRVLVLHSTETSGWPSYGGGATAPHLTCRADFTARKLVWRQHFRLDRSARALRNPPGGVETNRAGAVQLEIVGTCDRANPRALRMWELPQWVKADLGEFFSWCERHLGIPLVYPAEWSRYPDADDSARMTGEEWLEFRGVLGHLHVPENTHQDPGDFPIAEIVNLAKGGTMTDEEFVHLIRTVPVLKNASGADPDAVAWTVATGMQLADDKLDRLIGAVRELSASVAAMASRLAEMDDVLGDLDPTVIQAAAQALKNRIDGFRLTVTEEV